MVKALVALVEPLPAFDRVSVDPNSLVIDPTLIASLAGQLAAGDRAQHLVVFETVPGSDGPEIKANPVVPANPPVNLTVSPSTLPAGE